MKTRQLIAVVIALSAISMAGSIFAEDDFSFNESVSASTKSRAEVRAELEQARAAGLLNSSELYGSEEFIRPSMGARGVAGSRYSGRTREEVKTEAIAPTKKFKSSNDEMYMYGSGR